MNFDNPPHDDGAETRSRTGRVHLLEEIIDPFKVTRVSADTIVLQLPQSFPELTLSREGFLSKIAQAFGYDDIDFESKEFSDKFCVRSRDKKFAYDVCNPRMMEYLLANSDLALQIEGQALAFVCESKLDLNTIEPNLNRLAELRSHMLNYLFNTP